MVWLYDTLSYDGTLAIISVYLHCLGPWKKKSLSDFGIVTQCISPSKINDQYLTNVLLKINSKVRN